jgi:para-nitrobenzyl esterase
VKSLLIAMALLAAGIAWLPMARGADDPLVVKTNAGLVRGVARDGGGARFLGIPFAQPPVGELRWR